MSNYEQWESGLTPAGFAGRWARRWGTVLGQLKDATLELAKEAVRARFVPSSPDDAVGRIAADRRIERAAGESLETFRTRLVGAWEAWSWAGTKYGVQRSVGYLGLGTPAIFSQTELPVDGWGSSRWAWFRLVFTGRATWGAFSWGEAPWGGRLMQGIETADPVQARRELRRVLRTWRSARDRTSRVHVARGEAIWGRFRWGEAAWASTAETWGPPAWGSSEAVWGEFAWGVFA